MLLLDLDLDNGTYKIFLRLHSDEVKFKTKNYLRNKSSKVIFQHYALTVSLFKQIATINDRRMSVSINGSRVMCKISILEPTESFAMGTLGLLRAESFFTYCDLISINNLWCSEVVVEIIAENIFSPFNREYFFEWMRTSPSYEVLVYLPQIKEASNQISLGFINRVTHDIMVS